MNPIKDEIDQYCYSDCPNKIGKDILRNKNKEKIFNLRYTSIYLKILKRTNHIIKVINNTFDANNPNK